MSTSADAMTDEPNVPTTPPESPPPEPNAIRGAFVARTVMVSAAPGGLADATATSVSVTLRGAYLAHLGDGATEAVGGAPAGVDNLLRSAYAARLTGAAQAPQPGRRRAAGKAKPVRRQMKRVAKKVRVKAKRMAAKPKAKSKAKIKARPARGAAKRRTAATRKRATPGRRRR